MYVAAMSHDTPGHRTPEGRIVRTETPPNEELDPARLSSFLTPIGQFYVRCHGDVPKAIPEWRLSVGGLVERPLSLSVEELRALPQRELVVTLECAGNRRTMQRPAPDGVPWVEGAVSTARWGGVPLADVLHRAGVRAEAQHVRLIGGDRCATEAGEAPFARSLPVARALAGDVLLALTMNGEPLPAVHGAPVRLVVPTWYAMDSVKWLRQIELSREGEPGPFQAEDYKLWYGDSGAGEEIGPVRVASVIAEPRPPAPIRAGSVRVRGAAWTGTGTIAGVEVSTDGGASWRSARLLREAVRGAWQLWDIEWNAPAGEHTLLARARDTAGNRQPAMLPPNRKGYANNAVVPLRIRVEP